MLTKRISNEISFREQRVQKVTLVGSLGNLVLMLLKFVAGVVGNSAAMMADAVHSLSDFATDIIVIFFVRLASKPQDKDHSFGHGKYETMATAVIGLILIWVAALIFWSGITSVYAVVQGEKLEAPGYVALFAAIVSIVVKELLYQYTVHEGRKLNSKVMIANAWHHRSDALSSIGTMVGIGGAILLGPSWRVLDPIAAIVVSVFIIRVAIDLLIPCVEELLEKSLPDEDEEFIKNVIRSCPKVADPHCLRTRRIGTYCAIEVHFCVDGNMTIFEAHKLTRLIESKLCKRFGPQTIINTHVEPKGMGEP